MKTKLTLLLLAIAGALQAQPFYVDTTTPTTNTTTYSGALQIPGVSTNNGVTLVNTNNISYGDPMATAFDKLNQDIYFLWTYDLTNDFGGGGASTNGNYIVTTNGTGSDLTINSSFTLLATNITSYTISEVIFTGFTNGNGIYQYDPTNGLLFNGTNAAIISFPIGPIVLDPDASNYLGNAGITNLLQELFINQLVNDLKTNGLWTNQWYAIYPFAAGTPSGDAINLVSNNYTITWNGFMASAAAHGIFGVSNNYSLSPYSYGDAGLNETNFVSPQDNITLATWVNPVNTNGSYQGYPLDNISGSGSLRIAVAWALGIPVSMNAFLNDNGSPSPALSFTTAISFVASRTNSASLWDLWGNNPLTNIPVASTGTATNNIYIGNENYYGLTIAQSLLSMGYAAIGKGLSTNQMVALKTIIDRYNAFRPVVTNFNFTLPDIGSPGQTFPTQSPPSGSYWTLWFQAGTNTWLLEATDPSDLFYSVDIGYRHGSTYAAMLANPTKSYPVSPPPADPSGYVVSHALNPDTWP